MPRAYSGRYLETQGYAPQPRRVGCSSFGLLFCSPVTWATRPPPISYESLYVRRLSTRTRFRCIPADDAQEINIMLDTVAGVEGGEFAACFPCRHRQLRLRSSCRCRLYSRSANAGFRSQNGTINTTEFCRLFPPVNMRAWHTPAPQPYFSYCSHRARVAVI